MEIKEIISQLTDKFGDKLDVKKITESLQGLDHSKLNFNEIVAHLNKGGLLGDLDGDGKAEGLIDELKGKASEMFGNLFGKK